ncbi:hypothetical protein GCM10027072_09890 [Streptomyces bullii]
MAETAFYCRSSDLPGAWLWEAELLFFRRLLEERGIRTPDDFLPHYRKAATRLGVTNAEPAPKTIEGWIYEGRKPQRVFRPVIVDMLGHSIESLWTEVPEGSKPNFVPLAGASPTHPRVNTDVDLDEMKRTGAMAVRRAKDFLLGKDREAVGDDTLGLLDDEVQRDWSSPTRGSPCPPSGKTSWRPRTRSSACWKAAGYAPRSSVTSTSRRPCCRSWWQRASTTWRSRTRR